jgi:hypothetical protein
MVAEIYPPPPSGTPPRRGSTENPLLGGANQPQGRFGVGSVTTQPKMELAR